MDMFRKTATLAAAGALLLAPTLAACGSSANSSGMPTVTMMVGGMDKQIYLPYKLADELGFYKKYGVDVKLMDEKEGGVGADTAMVSGQVDLAGAWYIHAVDMQAKGKDVEGIIQLAGAPGEREMCRPDSGVQTGADFKDKNLGVTSIGSGTDALTRYLAEKNGVSTDEIHRVAMDAGASTVKGLEQKSVDCVITTQPTVTAIEKKGVGSSTIDLATTKGVTDAFGAPWPAASVLARTDWVEQNKDTAQKVVDALLATMHWIDTHSAAEIADKLPDSYVDNELVTKADYIKALEEDKGQFLPDGLMPKGGPETVLATDKVAGNDVSGVDLSKTYTNDLVRTALKKEGITPTTPTTD